MGLAQPRSVGKSAPGPSDGRRIGEDTATGVHLPLEDALVADLRHDSRNLFHKIHYCVEVIRGDDDGQGERGEAARMLVRAVEGLERLVGATLEYLAPLEIETIRMTAEDVAGAVESVLAGSGSGPVPVAVDPEACGSTLEVDPGRISAALRAVASRHVPNAAAIGLLGEAGARSLAIRVERLEPAKTEGGGGGNGPLEWASAARTVAAHGGRLLPIESSGGVVGCIITLPLVQEDAGGTSRER